MTPSVRNHGTCPWIFPVVTIGVDLQNPNLKNLDKTPQFVSTKHIIYFRDGNSVEKFIENVGPHFFKAVLVSADGKYPVDPVLKAKAEKSLLTDEEAMIVVFNSDAFSRITVATQRIFILDSLLMNSYRYFAPYEAYRMDLTAEQISKLISNFFSQWDSVSSPTHLGLNFSAGKTYFPPRESDWRFEMMGLSPRRTFDHDDTTAMFETIFYRVKGFLLACRAFKDQVQLKTVEDEFSTDFDGRVQRYYSFLKDKNLIGTVCVHIENHELLLRCFFFKEAFDTVINYQDGLVALLRAFPNTQVLMAKTSPSQQALFKALGFELVETLEDNSLKFCKTVTPASK